MDEKLRNVFPGHDCDTIRYAGLSGLKNGELLIAAEAAKFEVLITVDQGLEYEQNLRRRSITIIILRAKSSRLKDLLPLIEACLARLKSIHPGNSLELLANDFRVKCSQRSVIVALDGGATQAYYKLP